MIGPAGLSAETLPKLTFVPKRHWGRVLAAGMILLLLLGLIKSFAEGQIEWRFVGQFLTAPAILNGLVNTLVMTLLAMLLGILLGVTFAVMRMSENPVLRWVAILYLWIFRSTPALLQLLLWFNLALLFPKLSFFGLFEVRTVDVMTPFLSALLGLGIQQGAYTAEVVRSGLLAVDIGQYEAAKSIGMPTVKALRRIILPQAMRVIVPPIGNETISMVKLTSLASTIQYAEMLHNAQNIYFANARVIELLFVASFWYLAVVTLLSIGQYYIERHFSRGWERRKAVHAEADPA